MAIESAAKFMENPSLVRWFLDNGVGPDEHGEIDGHGTVLSKAVELRSICRSAVQCLVRRGADIQQGSFAFGMVCHGNTTDCGSWSDCLAGDRASIHGTLAILRPAGSLERLRVRC